jgi:hypothetical protein
MISPKNRLFVNILGKYLYSLIFLSKYKTLSRLKNKNVINIIIELTHLLLSLL